MNPSASTILLEAASESDAANSAVVSARESIFKLKSKLHCRRGGTPLDGSRWKVSERRGSTGWVSLESVGRRGGAGRKSEVGGASAKRNVGGGRSSRCRELRRRERVCRSENKRKGRRREKEQ
ncbi:unnamed protein product [Lactuca virosa]|uniref:Uncharacterized protein n=1 Tax=Lactuca virosa TaxID=75947 RepID=A0AAU9NBF4_9ASTR|nr:unnamed protein product [Lactuca virosa]